MEKQKASSRAVKSALVDTFARRSETAGGCPYTAMTEHVRELRAAVGGSTMSMKLYPCLAVRKIWSITLDPDASVDGYIQPNGSTYDRGFALVLSKRMPATRRLFTVAHEICHTFFYEVVPEMKFYPHQRDEAEERLCNFGAAELLMPASHVQRFASRLKPSLSALERVAGCYGVSLEAGLIRLRTLRLWDCALSLWYRRTDGVFRLERIFGDRADWMWVDDFALKRAWENGGAAELSGRATLTRDDRLHRPWSTFVYFQAKRVGDFVTVLWSPNRLSSACRQLTFFPGPGSLRRGSTRARDPAVA
jgi:hypothetical protein